MGFSEDPIDPATFLEDVEMRIGEIAAAEPFPEARKDVYKLTVDFGDRTLQSAAGLTDVYDRAELLGNQVVAVVNLGTVTIAGFESECLVTGVDGAGRTPAGGRAASDDADGGVVHLQPEREVPNGTRVY